MSPFFYCKTTDYISQTYHHPLAPWSNMYVLHFKHVNSIDVFHMFHVTLTCLGVPDVALNPAVGS